MIYLSLYMDVEKIPQMPESGKETPETPGNFELPKPQETSPAAQEAPAPALPAQPAPQPSQPTKDEVTKQVESILEEDLAETYAALPPDTKQKFKAEGERVTGEITKMMKTLKVRARKVLDLIRGWLKIIPGINAFFLEQEAKIKTDKVMQLAEEEQERRENAV